MTEKNYNPEQKQRKSMKRQEKSVKQKPAAEAVKKETKEIEKKTEIKKDKEEIAVERKSETKEVKEKKQEKQKKTEASVKGISLPLSTKISGGICRFIKKKNIQRAISELEDVLKFKRAVPMKGEVAHRKGKIMAGKYPKKAVTYFIKLLKSLQANANFNELNEPVVTEAFANIAYRPYGKFGRVRRKRTHVLIKARERKIERK